MVLIPYNNDPAPLSSSDGDLHLDKHTALGLESLPPGTRDSGFGASTASDMEALGRPADLSPSCSEDMTSFRVVNRRVPAVPDTSPLSGVSSFLSPPALQSDGKAGSGNDVKRKRIPPVPLPKPSDPPATPPKPFSAPVVPPKPSAVTICSPKPTGSPVLPPKSVMPPTPQKPLVPKKPDILDFSKHSAEPPAAPGSSPMKLVLDELSREVGAKSLKTSEQRSAVVAENPVPPKLSPSHVTDDVTIDIECPKVETKFPNSFVASKKKSPKGLVSKPSPTSAFHEVVATSARPHHSPQASTASSISSDSTSCSGLSSSFSSAFREEEASTASQEARDKAKDANGDGKGNDDRDEEEEEESDPAVPAPMPQLPYIRANHRQRLYQRSSASSSSGQSLRSANIPISTPLLLHTPLPDGGSGGGLRHFPLFSRGSDPPKPTQLSLKNHHQVQHPSPHGLPSPSSSVSSGASSSKDQAATPLLHHHQQHQHHHHQHQQEKECEGETCQQQEVPDYSAVGTSTCEHCALGKCQTVYLHMPGRLHIIIPL